jgi:hypothetical protein
MTDGQRLESLYGQQQQDGGEAPESDGDLLLSEEGGAGIGLHSVEEGEEGNMYSDHLKQQQRQQQEEQEEQEEGDASVNEDAEWLRSDSMPAAGSSAAAAAGSSMGSFVDDGEAGASGGGAGRRGVYVTLLGEAVEVLGEKGTKVGPWVWCSVFGPSGSVVWVV